MPKALPPAKAVHMLIEEELLEQIEDYQFKHRLHTRTETIKALLKLGLESSGKPKRASARESMD